MRVALYGRQSLDKKDSISIETQLEKGRLECEASDIVTVYEDKGFSGKNTKRPGYLKLMEDVERGCLDKIIVYKLDRFTRSVLDFATAWATLEKYNVQFISINEKFDTGTPLGKAMLYIAIVFAQMERETIAERVKDNYYERLKRGSWMGGPAPYGFKIGRLKSDAGQSIPTLVPGEMLGAAKEIFDAYASSGISLGAIATSLVNRGIPGPKRITWNNVSLARMLRNPAYVKADVDVYAYFKDLEVTVSDQVSDFDGTSAGLIVGKRGASTRKRKEIKDATFALANWEGIVESSVWLACQHKLAANEQIRNTGKGKYTWLSGLIKCGACQRSFRIIVDPKYPANKKLYCTGKIDKICSYVPKWHVGEIEAYVQLELIKVLEECKNEPVEEEPIVSNTYKIKLKKIEEATANLVTHLSGASAGQVLLQYINDEIERLETEKQEILDELKEKSKVRVVQYETVDFPGLDMEGKKIVVSNYIDLVEITDDDIWIKWRV
jgi:DNA invertase Pin-like site-specific DNA recombinase